MTLDEWLAQNSTPTTFEDSLRQQGYTQNTDNGYWVTPDGYRVSTDSLNQMLDSFNPTNATLANAMYGSAGQQDPTGQLGYYGTNINGTPYAQIGQFANNGADPYSSLQQEFQHLSQYGITPQWDPNYGWIAPVNDAYSQAHPYQNNSSIFDYGPILLGTAAVGGGLFGGAYDLGAGALGGDLLAAGAPDVIANGIDEALGSSLSGSELSGLSSLLPGVPTNPLGVPAEQAPAPVTDLPQPPGPGGVSGTTVGPATVPYAGQAAQSLAGTALSRILANNGTATTADWAKVFGTGLASGLGVIGANQQTNAFQDMVNKYLGIGEPYRNKLLASYSPEFDITNEPGYKGAVDSATNSFLRAASAGRAPGVSGGNPFDNPGAWAETLKYVNNNTTLPYLQNYRNTLAGAGGLGVSQSTPLATGTAQSAGGGINSLAYGLNQLINPSPSLTDILKAFENTSNKTSNNTSSNTAVLV